MALASQLPEESLTAMLPDQWAAANPKQVLVHRIEEARQVANRKRDDRQKRREKTAATDLRPADAAGSRTRPEPMGSTPDNPRQVRDFAKGIGKNARTDAIDAQVIARFGEVVRPAPQVAQSEDEIKLGARVQRRRQLLDFMNPEFREGCWACYCQHPRG